MLTSSFKSLRMEDDEQVLDFHFRLQDILNTMRGLDEEVKDSKTVKKILRSFPKKFHPRIIAIEESKNID